MLRRNLKTSLITAGIVGVLGAGVAVAATASSCPYGNTPSKTGQSQAAKPNPGGIQERLRKRDGTGPRHAQQMQKRRNSPRRQGAGRGPGDRGADCPYRG